MPTPNLSTEGGQPVVALPVLSLGWPYIFMLALVLCQESLPVSVSMTSTIDLGIHTLSVCIDIHIDRDI